MLDYSSRKNAEAPKVFWIPAFAGKFASFALMMEEDALDGPKDSDMPWWWKESYFSWNCIELEVARAIGLNFWKKDLNLFLEQMKDAEETSVGFRLFTPQSLPLAVIYGVWSRGGLEQFKERVMELDINGTYSEDFFAQTQRIFLGYRRLTKYLI